MSTYTLCAWPDPIIDTLGHDPRSEYVERFWLPTLGPTSLLLLRRVATLLGRSGDDPHRVDAAELSQTLGLGSRTGTNAPLHRSFERLVQFDLATSTTPMHYAVRRTVPPVNRRHVHRLPLDLQRAHDEWVTEQLTSTPLEHARRRARRLAFTLFEQGDDLDTVERTLLGVGFHPTVCRESAEWAHDRHQQAFAAVESAGATDESEAADSAA